MASRQSQSRLFIILGIVFMALSFAPTPSRSVWLPVGVVFLVIGLARRREAKEKTPPPGTGPT